jgi:hypothetical protein
MVINAAMTEQLWILKMIFLKAPLKEYSIIFLASGLLFAVQGYISDTTWMRAI